MIYNRLLVNDKSIENVCVWESYLPVTGMTMITKVVVHIRRPLLHWAWPLSWLIFVVNPQWVTHVNNFCKRGFRFRSGPFTISCLSYSPWTIQWSTVTTATTQSNQLLRPSWIRINVGQFESAIGPFEPMRMWMKMWEHQCQLLLSPGWGGFQKFVGLSVQQRIGLVFN